MKFEGNDTRINAQYEVSLNITFPREEISRPL